MTIHEIKAVISNATGIAIGTLDLRGEETDAKNPDGTPVVNLAWQYAWIEATVNGVAKRLRIVFPEEIVNTLKADRSFNGLALKHEVIPAHKAGDVNPVTGKAWTADLAIPYDRYTVITPKFTASF